MLRFLAARALPGIEHVDAQGYTRVCGPAAAPVWLRVHATRDPQALQLSISPADPIHVADIVARVRRMFALDANPATVAAVLGADPLLAPALARHPGLRMPGGWDGFETLLRAVLGQQVTIAGASTLTARLVEAFGEMRPDTGNANPYAASLNRMFPSPDRLVDAPLERIGLPRARAATLRTVAAAVLDGRLDFASGQGLDDFVARCTALPGIGPWTAHYVAMRGLGHPDAFPAGDLVLRRGLGDAPKPSMRVVEARAEAWRPWRAYAVIQLWNRDAEAAAARRLQEPG